MNLISKVDKGNMEKERILNLTHTDLDGVACGIVMEEVYGQSHTQVRYINNNAVDNRVQELLDTGDIHRYDKVYLTDIALTSKDLAEEIDQNYKGIIQIIDHHRTAEWLNQYEWAEVHEKLNNRKEAGVSLLWRHLKEAGKADHYGKQKGSRIRRANLNQFVEMVRSYDTWEWYETGKHQAKKLNDLFFLKSIEEFKERMNRQNLHPDLTSNEEGLLAGVQCKIDKQIEVKKKQLKSIKYEAGGRTYKLGVAYAEDYISEIGNELSSEYPEHDMIVLIDMGRQRMSYRTIHNEMDCSILAKALGGGGHAKSAGSPLAYDLIQQVITN